MRRDARRDLLAGLSGLALGILLLFWLPALVVLVRREAAYFTNGVLWSALIATVVVLLAGAGLTLWWSRRPRVVLNADRDGVRLPARRKQPAFEARWDELALVRLVGTTDPALAFYLREPAAAVAEENPKGEELDLSEPQFLRPLDFTADPPPPMRTPDRQAFERITALDAQEPDPVQEPPVPSPSPAEVLHGTPHVVRLVRTNPPVADVLRAITRLSAGRVRLE